MVVVSVGTVAHFEEVVLAIGTVLYVEVVAEVEDYYVALGGCKKNVRIRIMK